MDIPPSIQLNRPRRRRKRRSVASRPTPPAPLTLVSAAYDSGSWVQLIFDRAIDIAAIDVSAIVVRDGGAAIQFVGTTPATLVGPMNVEIPLTGFDDWLEPGVTMTVSAANGI